jgi:hypothetical protein
MGIGAVAVPVSVFCGRCQGHTQAGPNIGDGSATGQTGLTIIEVGIKTVAVSDAHYVKHELGVWERVQLAFECFLDLLADPLADVGKGFGDGLYRLLALGVAPIVVVGFMSLEFHDRIIPCTWVG